MVKDLLVLNKELAEILRATRNRANLTQAEVARRIGLSAHSGKAYISHLEKGMVKNPPLITILLYLNACGEPWDNFFADLATKDFQNRHKKIVAQLKIPEDKKKIEYDLARYQASIKYPKKEETLDLYRLKEKIDKKVLSQLNQKNVSNDLTSDYLRYSQEFLKALNEIEDLNRKWVRKGLKPKILLPIRRIVQKLLKNEIKRILAIKPTSQEKQDAMTLKLARHRIAIEKIEEAVHKVLCDYAPGPLAFIYYKDCARAGFSALIKYYGKDQKKLDETLAKIIRKGVEKGLKENILAKAIQTTVAIFKSLARSDFPLN